MIIRVQEEQAAALADIMRQTFYDTFHDTCSQEDMARFQEDYFNLEQVQIELSNKDDHYYFAMVDNKPAGFVRFMESYNDFDQIKKWKALELKRLYILKDYHGAGIAQQLMAFVENYAIKNAYEVIWLGVWEHNMRAKRFYQKCGFEDSGYAHEFPIGSTPQMDNWFWKFI